MPTQDNTTSPLIPFVLRQLGSDTVNTVNARDLHAFLEISKEYSTWIKTWLKKAHLVENKDYVVFSLEGRNPQGGRPSAEHHLTFDAAKCIGMMSGSPKGDEVRAYFLACEKTAQEPPKTKTLHNPMSQVMIDMVTRVDALEYEAAQNRQSVIRAEAKADMAIEEMQRFTLEEFILSNGLLRQFPETQWPSYAKWLIEFCLGMGMDVRKAPVYGKRWDNENTYPTKALTAWRQHELHKPRQLRIVDGVTKGE